MLSYCTGVESLINISVGECAEIADVLTPLDTLIESTLELYQVSSPPPSFSASTLIICTASV